MTAYRTYEGPIPSAEELKEGMVLTVIPLQKIPISHAFNKHYLGLVPGTAILVGKSGTGPLGLVRCIATTGEPFIVVSKRVWGMWNNRIWNLGILTPNAELLDLELTHRQLDSFHDWVFVPFDAVEPVR